MTPEQCRTARELLGWNDRDLATAAGCGAETVRVVESGASRPRAPTLARLRAAFEAAGIEFMDGDRPWVRLRKLAG
ncbi:helix-turn-helix domain-containing protein [Muricoccus radiodurans]|uniref:helix-turn-helix domain-containing protein n=1 Tax=Muricoccus radiodurans TaxID=2231721 RepID=UPI003CF32CF0